MLKIPLIRPDLPPYPLIEESFREILESGKITNFGRYVTEFEEEISDYLGTKVASVSSGTMGLILSLQALGIKPGQKIILPSFTFMATAQAVLYAGCIPVFAEVAEDLTLSVEDLKELLSRHTDAACVLPVHTYGSPCRVDEIQKTIDGASRKHSHPISLLYDAAHAFGSTLGNQRIGTFGDAEVFSLSVTKALVSVEGGVISSKDTELINRIRKMRNYGIDGIYDTSCLGLNGKMSEFHAVIGLYNLRRFNTILEKRTERADYYLKQIRARTGFKTQPCPEAAVSTFKDFVVLVPRAQSAQRGAIMDFLNERGIETRAYFYPPVHQQSFFKQFADRPLPWTEDLSKRVITLPFYTSITESEIDYIVGVLTEAERRFL